MRRPGKIVLGVVVGAGIIGGTTLLILRKRKATTSSSPTPTRVALTAAESLWPAPATFGTVAGQMAIGPSSTGNGPNGVYQLARLITAPQTGTYTLHIAADDTARITIDGQALAVINFGQGLVTYHVPLTAGPHVLLLTVANNALGQSTLVPYNSGSPNPTGATVQLTAPNGTTLITPGHTTGWHYSGYLPSLQVTAAIPLTLTGPI